LHQSSKNDLQPNQAPTPIGCLIFKELANQELVLDLSFRVSGEAAHCTDFNFCVNSF
jgi:dihydroneopterin aldolase